jgi:hypothetical protein
MTHVQGKLCGHCIHYNVINILAYHICEVNYTISSIPMYKICGIYCGFN